MFENADLTAAWKSITSLALKIIRIPFTWWYELNPWIKLSIGIVIGVFGILILIIALKNKEKWLHKQY